MLNLVEYQNVIANTELPENMAWYHGYKKETLFPIVGASGGVAHRFICYLVSRDSLNGQYCRWAIELEPFKMTAADFVSTIKNSITLFSEKLKNGIATKVDLDGGDLGRQIHN